MLTYMKNLNLENPFADTLAFAKGPTATYTLPQICLTQVVGRLLGKERICHFEEIEKDPFLARELGLMGGKLPDTTILYKDLKCFDSDEKIQMLKLVNDQVNLRQLKNQRTVILDFDSSVKTLYGTLKRLPDNIETLYCRGDKGFGSKEMYTACEAKMIGYVIKMKRSNPLLNRALSRPWCRFHEGTHIIEYTDFEYQSNGWSIPRRIMPSAPKKC